MKWCKTDAGHYVTDDGRFEILKGYNRVFGNCWTLFDNSETDYYAMQIAHEYTLREAKAKAEGFVKGGA